MTTVVLPQNSEMKLLTDQYELEAGSVIALEGGTDLVVYAKYETHYEVSVDFNDRRLFGKIGAAFGQYLVNHYTVDEDDDAEEVIVALDLFEE